MRVLAAGTVLTFLVAAGGVGSLTTVSFAAPEAPALEPAGYRTSDYRADVPPTVNGRRAISTEEAERLWRDNEAVFVDTLPQPPRPGGLPPDTIWHQKARYDIPRSVWLPDTGYGELATITEAYFERGLRVASGGDSSRRLVFYCLSNCWMSWNAAKRATGLGYRNVEWYADGTDGWAAHDLPLERREPLRPGQ